MPEQERTQEPTREQIRELWEWCGLKYTATKPHYLSYWSDVKGQRIELDLDLNTLFKYALPQFRIEYHNWRSVLHDWVDGLTGDYEKDALSLYWLLAQTTL